MLTYVEKNTKALFLSEIMPEIEAKLAQKDRMINHLTNTVNELKAQIQVRISKTM